MGRKLLADATLVIGLNVEIDLDEFCEAHGLDLEELQASGDLGWMLDDVVNSIEVSKMVRVCAGEGRTDGILAGGRAATGITIGFACPTLDDGILIDEEMLERALG